MAQLALEQIKKHHLRALQPDTQMCATKPKEEKAVGGTEVNASESREHMVLQ